jgi:hypothetical protein
MEGVFVGCDGNAIVVVAVVAITTRFNYTTFLPPSSVGFSICTMGNG